jgi:hypothetical protein
VSYLYTSRQTQQPVSPFGRGLTVHRWPAEHNSIENNLGIEATNVESDPITQQEDNAMSVEISAAPQYSLKYAEIAGDQIADFLARPRVLATYNWPVGTPFTVIMNPWYQYFSLPQVKEKTAGYCRFRGQLKLQFLVNGSSFHRGTMYVSYLPLSQEGYVTPCKFNDGIITTVTGTGVGSPNGAAYHTYSPAAKGLSGSGMRKLVPISQRQHVRLYPNINSGGSLILPFIFPHEYVPIDKNFLSVNGVTNTAVDMGELRFDSVGNLTFLGDNAPDAVDITVMASLESDYELAGPTVYLQSGEAHGGSKIGKSVPSNPKGSSWMGMVSSYGPTVARLMGFTNPPLLTDVPSVRIQNLPNLGNSQLSTRDEVLALHPETTLSSLNESLGGSESEMLISNLVEKESVITAFFWKAIGTNSNTGSVLFDGYVHPCMSPTAVRTGGSGSTYDQVFPIPMDWVAQAFRAWRGDITYSFEIVTTAFQKGRLKVSFEPSGDYGLVTDSVGINYTKILDINDGCKFDFTVPYMATTPWLLTDHTDPHVRPNTQQGFTHFSPGSLDYPIETLVPYNPRTMNGRIRVQVLNTLTNDLDATVIVTVKGGPNMEFAIPCSIDPHSSLQDQYFLQSGEDAYIGETIKSIRDVCHRSTPCGYFRGNATQVHMYTLPATGVPRGIGLNGGDAQLKVGSLYGLGSVSPHSYYQWFSSGYTCARSSHKVSYGGVGSNRPFSSATGDLMTVDRGIDKLTINPFTEEPTYPTLKSRLASDSLSAIGQDSVLGWFGLWSALSEPANAASMLDFKGGSALVPYQSIIKFQPSNQYYDYYRLVYGNSSGNLIGEPIYPSATGAAHNGAKILALASFFYPQDGIKVVNNSDSRSGGCCVFHTAAGADMAFGAFCNAPTWFRARRTNTFTNGHTVGLNGLVAAKMNVVYAESGIMPA